MKNKQIIGLALAAALLFCSAPAWAQGATLDPNGRPNFFQMLIQMVFGGGEELDSGAKIDGNG